MSRVTILLLCCVCTFHIIHKGEALYATCESGWRVSLSTGTCVKAFMEGKTWQDAKSACAEEGGHLVKIIDSKMNLLMGELLNTSDAYAWIGLHFSDQSTKWSNDATQMPGYRQPLVDDTPPAADGSCGAVWIDRLADPAKISWVFSTCGKALPYICEAGQEFCPKDWLPVASSRKCITISDRKMSWDAARTSCESQPGNKTQLVWIMDLDTSQFINDQLTSSNELMSTWIGLVRKTEFDSQWKGIFATFFPITYTNWGRREPAIGSCVLAVGSANKPAFWKTENCQKEHYFICETMMDQRKPQKRFVSLTVKGPQRPMSYVALKKRPVQGTCIAQNNATAQLGLRVFLLTEKAALLHGDYTLSSNGGVLSTLTSHPGLKLKVQKGSKSNKKLVIVYKLCVSKDFKIQCYAQDSESHIIGVDTRAFFTIFPPLQPIILIDTHMEGHLIFDLQTYVLCSGHVGSRGALELRVTTYLKEYPYWVVYADRPTVETNSEIDKLEYSKDFDDFGPYIKAKLQVNSEKHLKIQCLTYVDFYNMFRSQVQNFPPVIRYTERPKMFVYDAPPNGLLIKCLPASKNFIEIPSAFYFRNSEQTVLYVSDGKSEEYQMYKRPGSNYTENGSKFKFVGHQNRMHFVMQNIKNRLSFEIGCSFKDVKLCRIYKKTPETLDPNFEVENSLQRIADNSENKGKSESGSALGVGSVAVIGFVLGCVIGIFLVVNKNWIRSMLSPEH